jgi:Tol biopolymer transport system component
MKESMDRVVADWLHEGPEHGSREGLERTLAATRRVGQRPGWTIPERWLPMQLTMTRTRSQRSVFAIVTLALLIVALVATALYIGSQRRLPPSPFRNGAILWAADGDLFIADQLDGTPRTLVAGPEVDQGPVVSDQGDRIAFVRLMPDDSRIMAVSPDGSDLTELASLPGYVRSLDWSPDGSTLLTVNQNARADRYTTDVINSDGSGSRKLDSSFNETRFASWRPGGRHIAFEGNSLTKEAQVHVMALYIADANGTNVRQLPIGAMERLSDLEWSPDGKHLSFTRHGPGEATQIDIADIDEDGSLAQLHKLKLDPESSEERAPRWSPDGSQLAFELTKDSKSQIGIFNSDGSGYRIVVPDVIQFEGVDWRYVDWTWSPDGRSLVFSEVHGADPNDGRVDVYPRGRAWSVDVASGQQTEVQTPVESWQRLAP